MSGTDNCIITSSFDRSIKVWDLDYIFEEDHHIDKQELTIDSVCLSTKAGLAATVTRSSIGVWDIMLGSLRYCLANSSVGAIITHAVISDDGLHLASAESGDLLYWSLDTKKVIFSQKIPGIHQLQLTKQNDKCLIGKVT